MADSTVDIEFAEVTHGALVDEPETYQCDCYHHGSDEGCPERVDSPRSICVFCRLSDTC